MLTKRPVDDAIAQKFICYATLILLLVYFMKFLKNMMKRRLAGVNQNPSHTCCTAHCPHTPKPSYQNPPCASSVNSHKDDNKKKTRKKRHYRCMPEQWLPRNYSHSSTIIFDEWLFWTCINKEIIASLILVKTQILVTLWTSV